MHGPAQRMIQSQGDEFLIRNAPETGDRETPSYSDDGTLVGVLEQRSRPTVETLSSGEDVEADLEIRAVPDAGTTIRGAGETGRPTKLIPGPEYGDHYGDSYSHDEALVVVATHTEDGGVTVLTVVWD